MAKMKTIYRQIDQLFAMSRTFRKSKLELEGLGIEKESISSIKIYDDYREICMEFAEYLSELRGTTKFLICDVKSNEVHGFLLHVTKHGIINKYCNSLQKLENMINRHFGLVKWDIDNIRRQLYFKHII